MKILWIPGSTIDYDETYYENEQGYLYDESHFDFEADNSDDSDYSEA